MGFSLELARPRPVRFAAVAALALGLAAGCARERGAAGSWPRQPWAYHLPARIPSPFDPANDAPQLLVPSPRLPPWVGDAGAPFVDAVHRAAFAFQLPSELIWAVIKAESGFRADARSPAGARGLMQLMPATARSLGVEDSYDAEQNIFGGARYLRKMANRFDGELALMLAGYNAGPGAVRRHGGVPPFPETLGYVRRVLGYYWSTTSEGLVARVD